MHGNVTGIIREKNKRTRQTAILIWNEPLGRGDADDEKTTV